MGCSGSSEKKTDSNRVVPQKEKGQPPLSDNTSLIKNSQSKSSIEEESRDIRPYKWKKDPEPKEIKGRFNSSTGVLHISTSKLVLCSCFLSPLE